jgi:hypothetical protein
VARRGSYWRNKTGKAISRKRGEEMLEGEEEINLRKARYGSEE